MGTIFKEAPPSPNSWLKALFFHLNVPYSEVAYLNPSYKLGVIPYSSDGCYTVCLPIGKVGTFVANEDAIYKLANKDTLSSGQILAMVGSKDFFDVIVVGGGAGGGGGFSAATGAGGGGGSGGRRHL